MRRRPIESVQTGWPKPWFFFRVLLFIVVVYFGFAWMMQTFGNPKMIPGMILMGSLSIAEGRSEVSSLCEAA